MVTPRKSSNLSARLLVGAVAKAASKTPGKEQQRLTVRVAECRCAAVQNQRSVHRDDASAATASFATDKQHSSTILTHDMCVYCATHVYSPMQALRWLSCHKHPQQQQQQQPTTTRPVHC
jgi:hypothetical protein